MKKLLAEEQNIPPFLDGVSANQSIKHWIHALAHIFNQHTIAVCYCSLNGVQISEQENTTGIRYRQVLRSTFRNTKIHP